jgi:hypothetical protein
VLIPLDIIFPFFPLLVVVVVVVVGGERLYRTRPWKIHKSY